MDPSVGHLNGILARVWAEFEQKFSKKSNARGGMLKLRFDRYITQEKSSTLEHQHGCSFTERPPQRRVKTGYCGRCENGEFEVDYVGETCKTSPRTKCLN